MLSESGRGHEAKCQGIQSDCPTVYLGVTCSELRVQRCSAKDFGRTFRLNPLARSLTHSLVRGIAGRRSKPLRLLLTSGVRP